MFELIVVLFIDSNLVGVVFEAFEFISFYVDETEKSQVTIFQSLIFFFPILFEIEESCCGILVCSFFILLRLLRVGFLKFYV